LAFALHLAGANQAYLDNLPLSPNAKARLRDFMQYGLADVKDDFRTDPANRPYPNKPLFVRDFFIIDGWGDDHWHRIEFTIDDSQISQGKLIVVFIDHTDGEWNWSGG
jgi:hypothetical protein